VIREGESETPFMRKMRELGFETKGYAEDWWQIGRIRFKDGFVSFSMDGKPLVRKPLVDANGGNLGTLRWSTEPNNFCHATSDSVFVFHANPPGPLSTTVTAKWLVHKDAVEGWITKRRGWSTCGTGRIFRIEISLKTTSSG